MKDLFGQVSTADTGERSDHDFYPTPRWMTLSLLHFHPDIKGMTVLEPCSGRDDIANVLREVGCEVFTNDLNPQHPAQTHGDATTAAYWETAPPVGWVISNLPFDIAFQILPFAVEHARIGVAMVLRKSFLEPTEERGPWLSVHPPTAIVGEPRHSFRGQGSDSVASDWFLWHRRLRNAARFIVIDHLAKTRRFA